MDDAERQRLHTQLDRILDERIALEEANEIALGGGFVTPYAPVTPLRASRALNDAIALAADAIGQPVRKVAIGATYEREDQQRALLKYWLNLVIPLLYAPASLFDTLGGRKTLTIFNIIDAISALDAGEVMPIFAPKTGRNRRRNHWSLAQAKLDALLWKKRLRALGFAEKDANYRITVAFGEQWDTIRRWDIQCERTLGEAVVRAALSFAGSETDTFLKVRRGIFGAVSQPDPLVALEAAGGHYQYEKRRAADLSPRKGRSSADE